MSIYADMTEEQLEAEIAALRTKIRTGQDPAVRSVTGEGRRIEWAGGTVTNLRRLLREAELALATLQGTRGNAIGVRF
jgi:hypothetical protein